MSEFELGKLTPVWLLGSASALAAGQVILFIVSQPLCIVSYCTHRNSQQASNNIVNGAFIAALLNLLSLVLFYRGWNVSWLIPVST